MPHFRRNYKSKTNSQDAHEAIRPTNVNITPQVAYNSLSGDVAKLYKLIWERFMASQMADSVQETVSVDITAANHLYKATGYTVLFDGFTALYEEQTDEKKEKETALPPLEETTKLKLREIDAEQKFTQPPSEYTEATLIKALEENGIGRPSTYAPIIHTIIERGYVERSAKKLFPTALGITVNDVLAGQFSDIVNVKFTAGMENSLDKIEEGEAQWTEVIQEFYDIFQADLEKAEKEMDGQKIKVPDEVTDEICEICGKPMVIKIGRFGKFLACSGFPDCTNTKRIVKDTGGVCPKCHKKVLQKKSKKGKKYFGCEDNPNCEFMTWDTPVSDKCPKCNDGTTLFKKGGKMFCLKDGCGYEVAIKKEK